MFEHRYRSLQKTMFTSRKKNLREVPSHLRILRLSWCGEWSFWKVSPCSAVTHWYIM